MAVRWDVICIGNLSRNLCWGEGEDKPVRAALCTSTPITGDDFRLPVDPAFAAGVGRGSEGRRVAWTGGGRQHEHVLEEGWRQGMTEGPRLSRPRMPVSPFL